ncbi:MAG: hypothetical protein WBA10_08190 [Elainellaceae cyanobacterium]
MKYALEHRFQAALVAALWGYRPNAAVSPLPSPTINWARLASSNLDVTNVASQYSTTPLNLAMALLPLLLRYSDDEPGLRRCLASLTAGTTPESNVPSDSTAIAVEGLYALHHLVSIIVREQSPLDTAALLPLIGPKCPHLSPYLSTVLTQRLSGAGLVQRLAAMEPLADSYSTEPEAHQVAMALALALYSAVKTPDHSRLACQRLFPLSPPASAGPTSAIAGFLCGLYHGLPGLSLVHYRLLETTRLPGPPDAPESSTSLPQLSQMLVARWAGALQPQISAAAIAPPDVIHTVTP